MAHDRGDRKSENVSEQEARPPHIQILKRNTRGNDFMVGDIHGCSEQLKKIIDQLGPDDRLFLVGDLADRGKDAKDYEVYDMIIDAKKKGKQIYATRGNHEQIFLQLYNYFITEDKLKTGLHPSLIKNIKNNGGQWMLNMYDAIKFGSDQTKKVMREKIEKIANYIKSLPYIIHAEDFNIVHANMPFSDIELMRRIRESKENPKELFLDGGIDDYEFNTYRCDEEKHREKNQAIWSRISELDSNLRIFKREPNEHFIVTYCGHDIVVDASKNNFAAGLRKDSLHINLDIGGCAYGQLLVVNHTKKSSELIGEVENLLGYLSSDNQKKTIKNQIEEFKNLIEKELKNHPSHEDLIKHHLTVCAEFKTLMETKIRKQLEKNKELKFPEEMKKIKELAESNDRLKRDLPKYEALIELIGILEKKEDNPLFILRDFYKSLISHKDELLPGTVHTFFKLFDSKSTRSKNFLERLTPQGAGKELVSHNAEMSADDKKAAP